MPYGQLKQGHRSDCGQKKRFKDHIKSILKNGNIPCNRLEVLASNLSTCAYRMSYLDAEFDRAAALRLSQTPPCRSARPIQNSAHQCTLCDGQCDSFIGRHSQCVSRIGCDGQCDSHIGCHSHSKTRIQRLRGRRCHP